MPRSRALLALPLLLAFACSDGGPTGRSGALAEARARWAAAGIDQYRMTVRVTCFCDPSGTFTLLVEDGVVVGASDETGQPLALGRLFPTVEEIFDAIEHAIETGGEAEVTYHPDLGYPLDAVVDAQVFADDHAHYEVLLLQPEGALVAALEAARARWADRGSSSYDLDLRRACECLAQATGLVKVRVRQGEIVSRTAGARGDAVEEPFASLWPDVQGLFRAIEQARLRGAERIDVEFDPDLGHPVRLTIDLRAALADDEIVFETVKLLLQPGTGT